MNYRHSYHAGNFADVFKHVITIALIQSLQRKETPFCYLETHAGAGCYDLLDKRAQKSKEYEGGIAKIIPQQSMPDVIRDYVNNIQAMNTAGALQHYPGSPLIAQHFLRPQDRAVLCELHDEEYEALKSVFRNKKQVSAHHQDGYLGLKAFLPPKERRGLILIDPPYEKQDEFEKIPNLLAQALQQFETGTYATWYPIKHYAAAERFRRNIKAKIQRETTIAELCIHPDDTGTHLNGCGMVIINPPWQFQKTLDEILPWLWNHLSIDKKGHFKRIS